MPRNREREVYPPRQRWQSTGTYFRVECTGDRALSGAGIGAAAGAIGGALVGAPGTGAAIGAAAGAGAGAATDKDDVDLGKPVWRK